MWHIYYFVTCNFVTFCVIILVRLSNVILSESNRCWMLKQTLIIFTGNKHCPLTVTHSCRTWQRYCFLKLDLTCFIYLLEKQCKQYIKKYLPYCLCWLREKENEWMDEQMFPKWKITQCWGVRKFMDYKCILGLMWVSP